jgi:hypothetical protein
VVLDTARGRVEVSVVDRDGPLLPPSCGKQVEPTPVLEATVRGIERREGLSRAITRPRTSPDGTSGP